MSTGRSRAWSWRQAIIESKLMATTKHVLLTISCFMNEMGQGAYPTVKQLAAATGLSERAVCEHVQKAVAAGFLTVRQHGFRGQKWKNNDYIAAWPEIDAADEGTDPTSAASGDQAPAEKPQGTDAGSVPSDAKVLTVVPKGTDPNDKKALTVRQSNSPVQHSNNSPGRAGRARDPSRGSKKSKKGRDPTARQPRWRGSLDALADEEFA